MMLNLIMNEYIASFSKTMHSKLSKSPAADPHKHIEPANGFTSTDSMDVQSL